LGTVAVWKLDHQAWPAPSPGIQIDGHLRPCEWILQSSKIMKTDALDHSQDHFFPGVASILWDVSGAILEADMSREEERCFLEECRIDAEEKSKVPFYKLAYSAFKMGYCSVAAYGCEGPDAVKFRKLAKSWILKAHTALK